LQRDHAESELLACIRQKEKELQLASALLEHKKHQQQIQQDDAIRTLLKSSATMTPSERALLYASVSAASDISGASSSRMQFSLPGDFTAAKVSTSTNRPRSFSYPATPGDNNTENLLRQLLESHQQVGNVLSATRTSPVFSHIGGGDSSSSGLPSWASLLPSVLAAAPHAAADAWNLTPPSSGD
jgi:hypothetical protein